MVPSRRLEQVRCNLKKDSIGGSEKLGDGPKDYSTKIFPANDPETCATTERQIERTIDRERWPSQAQRKLGLAS